MESDACQELRDGYRAVGLGIGDAMLRLFGQGSAGAARWAVVDLASGEVGRTREVVAEDLFGSVPGHWEVTRVDAACFRRVDDRVAVIGHVCCRPRGVRSFDTVRVPFAHVWTMRGVEAVRVVSYLDGIELRRVAG